MSDLPKHERLQLAVKAQAAVIRADQARARAALLERRVQPVTEAYDRFTSLYRREPDMAVPGDQAAIGDLLRQAGAVDVTAGDLVAAAGAADEIAAADLKAVEAIRTVSAAMDNDEQTVFEWAGVDRDVFETLVKEELARESA